MTIKRTSKTEKRKRVKFNEYNNCYHDAPEDFDQAWYSPQELKKSLSDDIREALSAYFKRVADGKQPDDKNYLGSLHNSDGSAYNRGLALLDPQEKNRRTRCELYRSLVLRQYHELHKEMAANHANEILQTFATERSRWARTSALAVAAEDACQARQVYREAFLSKDGANEGLGICPCSARRRSLRGSVKRKSDLARSA